MDHSLIELLLVLLLFVVILSFVLTIRIASIVRETPEPEDVPFTLPLDEPVPRFVGKMLKDSTMVSLEFTACSGTVLVFLSSACSDCRKKLPELTQIQPAMRKAEIQFIIVAMESERRARIFLGETPLFDYLILLDKRTKKILNPSSATPFYIFVDDQGLAKASNFIGDENWQLFIDQMHEIDPASEGEAAHGVQ